MRGNAVTVSETDRKAALRSQLFSSWRDCWFQLCFLPSLESDTSCLEIVSSPAKQFQIDQPGPQTITNEPSSAPQNMSEPSTWAWTAFELCAVSCKKTSFNPNFCFGLCHIKHPPCTRVCLPLRCRRGPTCRWCGSRLSSPRCTVWRACLRLSPGPPRTRWCSPCLLPWRSDFLVCQVYLAAGNTKDLGTRTADESRKENQIELQILDLSLNQAFPQDQQCQSQRTREEEKQH